MSDRELKNQIINILKQAKTPLTFDQIADSLTLKKDFWRITAILNQFKIFGVTEEVKEPYKAVKYKYVS